MKRMLLVGLVVLSVGTGAASVRAGGGHGWGGGGWHGGGCWGGGWHGGWGPGWCGGGFWPFLGFGIGFGSYYPAYGYGYGYPAYGYGYGYPAYGHTYAPVAYARPAYVYRPAQPNIAVVAARTAKPTANLPVYASAGAQRLSAAASRGTVVPTAARGSALATSAPSRGTWVPDPTPYSYTPAATASYANNTKALVQTATIRSTSGGVPLYAVAR